MSFRCIKAFMHAFSGRFSRASLEGISFKFFVCFIFNVSLGSAPKRKNFDIQRNTRVGSGGRFTSNRLSNDHIQKCIQAHVTIPYLKFSCSFEMPTCCLIFNPSQDILHANSTMDICHGDASTCVLVFKLLDKNCPQKPDLTLAHHHMQNQDLKQVCTCFSQG